MVAVLAPVVVLLELMLVLLDPVRGVVPPEGLAAEVPPEALAAKKRPEVLEAEAAVVPPEVLLQLVAKAVLVEPADCRRWGGRG